MRWHLNAIAIFATLTLVTATNLPAQTENTPSISIEEIVVTATKRATSLQDAPISISVISVEQMDQLAINDVLDLQSSVPSLKIAQQQFANQNTFLIRGFGNGANNPGVEPAVAISIDGVMISRNQSALNDLISVERIEVIKGPQSTLFGKNASAGVISITTKRPEQEFGGKIELTGGDFGLKKLRGTVTGPITEKTSFRLSASTTERDGFVEMRYRYVAQPLFGLGNFSLPGGGVSPKTFSSITSLIISKRDRTPQEVVAFMQYLVNSDIYIGKQDAISIFGHYKVTGFTVNAANAEYYDLNLTFLGGAGALILDDFYEIINFVKASAAGDLNFVFTQAVPAVTWTVTHNFGKFPSVSIVDTNDQEVFAQVDYVDVNSLTITFSSAQAGKAYIN